MFKVPVNFKTDLLKRIQMGCFAIAWRFPDAKIENLSLDVVNNDCREEIYVLRINFVLSQRQVSKLEQERFVLQ